MHGAIPNKARRRLSAGTSLLLSLLVWSIPISARNFQEVIKLEPGKSIPRELDGGGVDTFRISVSENQYFRVVVEQTDIEVTVTLSDQTKAQIVQTWSSSGASGPLYISAIAGSANDYTLQVQSLEKRAGQYKVTLESVRTQAPADRERVTAERALAEGQRLQKEASRQAGDEASKSRQQAFKKFTEAAKHFGALKDAHGQVRSLHLAGVIQRILGQQLEAKQFMTQALDVAPDLAPNDWRLEATVTNDLGLVYIDLQDHEKARSLLRRALQIFEDKSDRRGRASVSNNLALSYSRTGEGREAIRLYEIVLQIRQQENDKNNEILTLNNLGGAYQSLGEFREALVFYERAMRAWRDSKSDRLPTGLNNVAVVYDQLGLWQAAIDHYRESLAIAVQSGRKDRQATALFNIGELYSNLNDSSRALESYGQALVIQRELKNQSEEANILAHIGTVHISLNNADEALKYLEQALRIIEANPNAKIPRIHAYTLLGIGEVYRLQGKPPEALKYFEQARKLAETVANRQQESDAQQKLGETHHALRDWTKAQESFDKALALRRKLEDTRGEATTLYHLASLKRDLNQLAEAAAASAESLKRFEALRENIASQQLRTSYFETTQQSFELYIDVKLQLYRMTSDVRHVEDAFSANEQAHARSLVDILAQTSPAIHHGASSALLQKKQTRLESLNSKANNRQALLNEREVQQRAYDQNKTNEQLQALARTDVRLTALAAGIKTLIAEIDDLDTQIRRESPKYAALTQPQPLNLREIQGELLDDNTILLEYSLGDRRSFAFVVSSTSIKAIELPKRAEIEPVARRLGSALTARNVAIDGERPAQRKSRLDKANTEYLEAASVLSKMVIEPVASLLDKKRVVVVADGALQLIPFAVLPVSLSSDRSVAATPRLLIESYEIITLPSASVLGVQRRELKERKAAPHAVAVLANPVFDSSDPRVRAARKSSTNNTQVAAVMSQETKRPPVALSRDSRGAWVSWLPYSQEEAKAIAKVAPRGETMLALDFKANRSTMMSQALSQYRIVHFATHGVADPDHPELSEIILSLVDENGVAQDGRVRLYEIYNLNLPAELVVISACESGVGKQLKGEGLIALTRGFMYAGAARVVASLWKVDDSATAALMAEFYKEMFTNGREPAAALRAAQLNISKQKSWREPYFWAGFVLQGEWR